MASLQSHLLLSHGAFFTLLAFLVLDASAFWVAAPLTYWLMTDFAAPTERAAKRWILKRMPFLSTIYGAGNVQNQEDLAFYTLKEPDLADMGWLNELMFKILNETKDASGLSLRDSYRLKIKDRLDKLLAGVCDDVASNFPRMAFFTRAWEPRIYQVDVLGLSPIMDEFSKNVIQLHSDYYSFEFSLLVNYKSSERDALLKGFFGQKLAFGLDGLMALVRLKVKMGPFLPQNPFLDTLKVYFTDVPSVRYKFSGILEPLNCGFCESLVRWAVHLFATAVIDDSEAVVPSTPGGDPERPDPSLSGNRQSP